MNYNARANRVGYLAKSAYKVLGHVSYNGVKFPPYCNMEMERRPIYASDERSVEAIEVTITVSGIVIPSMFFSGDASGIQPLSAQPNATFDSENPFDYSVDQDIEAIRHRLEKPGKVLEIVGKGVGRLIVGGDITAPAEVTSDPTSKDYYYNDIQNGPKPQQVTLRNYGPKTIYVEWKCKTYIHPCDNKRIVPPYLGALDILSMTYSSEIEVLTNLSIKRITRGKLRIPAVHRRQNQLPVDTFYRDYLCQVVFPLNVQFKRTANFGLSEDKTELRFTITDEEIASDSAPPVGFVDVPEADHNVESSLGDGAFKIWNGTISVSGEVLPGYSKTLIYLTWAQIMNALISNKDKPADRKPENVVSSPEALAGFAQQVGATLDDEAVELATAPPSNTKTVGDAWITSIRIKDSIFSRKATVECSYKMTTDLNRILVATGILQPLPPWLVPDMAAAWNNWAAFQREYAAKGKLYQLPLDSVPGQQPSDACAVSFITPETPTLWTQPYSNFRNEKDTDDNEEKTALNDDNNGYLTGNVSYRVEEDREVHHYRYLSDSAGLRPSPAKAIPHDSTNLVASLMTSAEALGLRLPDGTFDPNNENTVTAKKTSVRSVADEKRTLIVEGYFVRIGTPPVVPEVVGFGKINTANQNLAATAPQTKFSNPTKIGKDIVIRKTLGTAVLMKNGVTAQIHAVAFRKAYALRHEPLDGTIIMNNTPEIAGV